MFFSSEALACQAEHLVNMLRKSIILRKKCFRYTVKFKVIKTNLTKSMLLFMCLMNKGFIFVVKFTFLSKELFFSQVGPF